MTTESIQRQIDRLLDDAEVAVNASDWPAVAEKARAVLAIDAGNEDAATFMKMAEANRGGRLATSDSFPARTDAPAVSFAATRTLPASFAGGRYAVSGFLGEGGSKRVYLARDTGDERAKVE